MSRTRRHSELKYDESFNVQHTEPILNAVIIMNSDMDINTRKAVVHAINKGTLMDDLGGVEEPVYQLFPLTAPYCDVYLTPKFDGDLEKARELNCGSKKSDSTNPQYLIGRLL